MIKLEKNSPLEFFLHDYYDDFLWYYDSAELESREWCKHHIKEDWSILDIGANVGLYTVLFSKLASKGKVYACEPTETISLLKENIQKNSCKNVSVFQQALGDSSEKSYLSIPKIYRKSNEDKVFNILTIDDFVDQQKINKLDLLKIDVDTFNLSVTMGAVKTLARFNPYLLLEVVEDIFDRYKVHQLVHFLTTLGYDEAIVLDGENFLLKRKETSVIPKKNLNLIYPDIKIKKVLEPLPDGLQAHIIPVSQYKKCHHVKYAVCPDGGVMVTTPLNLWHTGITYPLQGETLGKVFSRLNIGKKYKKIFIKCMVQRGKIGVGIMGKEGFVSREQFLYENKDEQSVCLSIFDSKIPQTLQIRQANYRGIPSEFIVKEIKAFY